MSRNSNYDFAEHAKGLLRKDKPQTQSEGNKRRDATTTAKQYYHPEVYGHLKKAIAQKIKGYGSDV